ncbi:MAG: aspartate aminotransferase family protein [Ilumatobacteraceae bacterium]|nr:aspartate aminotransferase family protein [Ilumatobacteraceae bacterium]
MPGKFLHPFAKPARESFITIARGEGALLWDTDGNQLIDGMASLWYCAIGHGRADMAHAISSQVTTLESYSAFDPFTNAPADQLAQRIALLSPLTDARVFLCSSGSESIDSAMKMARLAHVQAGHPERTIIISRTRGYHGTNYGGTSAQGIAPNKVGYGTLLDDVIQVDADDIEALALLMSEHSSRLAAVLAEPIQGAGGVFPPEPGYLASLRRLCDQHGAYLIFDEVITAFGRLGTWFGATYFGVEPDMITFAKAVTSGYLPLGGVVVGQKVCAALESDSDFFMRHGYTYSGHATACAAALANIDILEQEALLERSVHIGQRLNAGLQALADDGIIKHARGEGAVWAAALHPHQDAVKIRDRMLELGAITRAINDANTFCPPLVITDPQLDSLIDIFATAASGK